ncbi:MAG: type II toxin-antitoxin system RelE/ParE family toxin [Bacteroidia bacterium]|nr:type II toxin-antitoxin system RelE/ParE family toxin [Bacteroidia bacterium]
MGKKIRNRQIKWDISALSSFIDLLDRIREDSPTNAKRVKTRITNLIKAIPSNPEMFREDELKLDNDGTFRVFNKDRIRVSYKIEPDSIIIARVRHSSQEPIVF